MPQQEVFFEQMIEDRRLQVLKTYDQNYAREAFETMDEDAQAYLWKSLGIDEIYEPADVPLIHTQDGKDILWDELLASSREDGNQLSFFVVNEESGTASDSLYVAPDWPSARDFANKRIDLAH
jgi:hypothetical protein